MFICYIQCYISYYIRGEYKLQQNNKRQSKKEIKLNT